MYDFNWIYDFLKKWNENEYWYKTNFSIIRDDYKKFKRVCSDSNTLSWPILTKNDLNFLLSIEDWVKDLVNYIVINLDLITIGSCEWHKYLSNDFNISKRFIKIIWRNQNEYNCYYSLFYNSSQAVNKKFKNIKIWLFDFKEKFPDNNIYHLCFITFVPFVSSPELYFQEVDSIYKEFYKKLKDYK